MPSTLLVVGSAPCLHDDVARALALRPLAAILLVNGACTAIENAEHVLAGHTDKAEAFAAARRKKFPNAPLWRLHATTTDKCAKSNRLSMPSVTDWWGKTFANGATSIAKGAALGLEGLQFDEVIICGAPMDGSGYFKEEAIVPQGNIVRVGDPKQNTGFGQNGKDAHRVIQNYRRRYKLFAEKYRGRVFSMSGYTQDCSGAPV